MQNSRSEEIPVAWHNLSRESVLTDLDTSAAGLSQSEAQARLAKYGANRLPQAARRSAVLRFLLQFHHVLIYVLIGSATITAFWGIGWTPVSFWPWCWPMP